MLGKIVKHLKEWCKASSLLSSIYLRDSDEKIFRDLAEYWGSPDRNKDMSHIFGCGRWNDMKFWDAYGEKHEKMFLNLRNMMGGKGETKAMLEWGVGGGCNLRRLQPYFACCYGIDISSENFKECKRILSPDIANRCRFI